MERWTSDDSPELFDPEDEFESDSSLICIMGENETNAGVKVQVHYL